MVPDKRNRLLQIIAPDISNASPDIVEIRLKLRIVHPGLQAHVIMAKHYYEQYSKEYEPQDAYAASMYV
jgi:hypothetical protein